MFENTTTYTKQGDIGEARAIYEYTKLGYGVSRTIFDSMKYDLIVDILGTLYKVQVKTTKHKSEYGVYRATLKVSGGNRSTYTTRKREDSDYDILFILSDNNICWSIPVENIDAKSEISLGTRYDEFKIQ